jgi:hypothetical protein
MDTLTTTRRVANPSHPRMYQRLQLQPNTAGAVAIEDAHWDSNHTWYSAFIGVLSSVNFNGEIEWTYEHTEHDYCLSIRNLSHVDSAVHIVSTIALELTDVVDRTWNYQFVQTFGESVAQVLLRDSYLKDVDYYFDGVVKRGWQLVFPNIDTTLLTGVRHALPRTLADNNGSMEQF